VQQIEAYPEAELSLLSSHSMPTTYDRAQWLQLGGVDCCQSASYLCIKDITWTQNVRTLIDLYLSVFILSPTKSTCNVFSGMLNNTN